MGLDQSMYVATKSDQYDKFNQAEFGPDESMRGTVAQPREIARWRKHPNLQGWMERLWYRKGAHLRDEEYEKLYKSSFNHVELELSWDDLDKLEQDVKNKTLPSTGGFSLAIVLTIGTMSMILSLLKLLKQNYFLD